MILSNEQIIALQSIKGLGSAKFETLSKLLADVPSSAMSWGDIYSFIEQCVASKAITRLSVPNRDEFMFLLDEAERLLEKSRKLGINAVSRFQSSFPSMLLSTVNEDTGKPEIPALIWYKGDLSITSKPALAVIGTREPTDKGKIAGEYYAEAFASIGVNIVSGLAVGCDTAGHRGALNSTEGVTTAIMANGLDSIYPRENSGLAEKILEKGGLLLSENPIGTPANRYNLVSRDRLQAGLADATLVVQTGINGGTMHAVKATAIAGKPIFVVGFEQSQGEKTAGNDYIIQQYGAKSLRVSSAEIKSNPDRFLSMLKERTVSDDLPLLF